MRLKYSTTYDIDVKHNNEELVMWIENKHKRGMIIFAAQHTYHPLRSAFRSTLHYRIIINAEFRIATAKLITSLVLL